MTNIQRRWFPLAGTKPVRRDATSPAARKAQKQEPIDPLTGPKLALAGRVVTMDDAFTVNTDAVVFIDQGAIVAVQDRAQPAPAGFDHVPLVDTGGTLFPGLIELHNHLSYNALPLWNPVPKLFQHRGQWPGHPDYRKLISGPMTVVGEYRNAQGKPSLL
ncbi:MAG: amidohydrolase, partial [Nitrospirota bacterium]